MAPIIRMRSAIAFTFLLASTSHAFVSVRNGQRRRPFGVVTIVAEQDDGRRRQPVQFYSSATQSLLSAAANNNQQQYDETCDVLVLGSGPAARAAASLLQAGNLQVMLADQTVDRAWPPNYGVWQDEWQAVVDRYAAMQVTLHGGQCGTAIDRAWPVTDCYFGGSFDIPTAQRLRLDRPYNRVDKHALQTSLTTDYQIVRANHISKVLAPNVYTPAGSLVHDATGTTIQLQCIDRSIVTVRCQLVLDCTGHETKLLLRKTGERPPGFQIAYGCVVEVDETNAPDANKAFGPYDKNAMTLFDYRTDHFDNDIERSKTAHAAPTFMYAMPLYDNVVFFEETSLVARPALSFQECKDRCMTRLQHHGITVTKIQEEEFCYIPMGGSLPLPHQRVLALGGSAAMVHPATGFHLCRCLMGAADLVQAVQRELLLLVAAAPSSSSSDGSNLPNLDRAAAAAYHALWSPDNVRQRNFAVFGGEFLMKQNVVGLRGFFDGFFRLPLPLWAGFLAGWPGLPHNDRHETWWARMWYGLNFIVRIPPSVAADMMGSILSYTVAEGTPLMQSVTPLFGAPASYEYRRNTDNVGDVAAKMEARQMIQASRVEQDLPVAFEADTLANTEPVKIKSSAEPTRVAPKATREPATAVSVAD